MVAETGATELHFTASEQRPSSSRFTRDGVYMGGALYPFKTVRPVTTTVRVRSIITAAS